VELPVKAVRGRALGRIASGYALGIATMGYVAGDRFWPTVIVVSTLLLVIMVKWS
jgi:hypothetical protein